MLPYCSTYFIFMNLCVVWVVFCCMHTATFVWPLLWFRSRMPPCGSCVQQWKVTGSWRDYSTDEFIIKHALGRWDLVGKGRSLGAVLWRIFLLPKLSLSIFASWLPFHHDIFAFQSWLNLLKLWTTENLSLFKLWLHSIGSQWQETIHLCGHLNCLQFLVLMNTVTMNVTIQMFCQLFLKNFECGRDKCPQVQSLE